MMDEEKKNAQPEETRASAFESQERMNFADLARAEQELTELKAEQGEAPKMAWWVKALDAVFAVYYRFKVETPVDKKKYIWLAVLTGWLGGHRFYSKHYISAVVYLLIFWTAIPIAMTFVDLLIVIPKPADEEGKIVV